MEDKTYIAIDLKSFYASVECIERGLDPMTAHLVVADQSRTSKTICLAVTPALKSYGIPGRPRLFEVESKVRQANGVRKAKAPQRTLTGSSFLEPELKANPSLALDFVVARPQMAKYLKTSTDIYKIYLNHVSPQDIHVYSIDEVFIDATGYIKHNGMSPHDFAMMIINDVFTQTKITATAGIGTNMYLAKVAMDIVAKRMPPDKNGARIAHLDVESYRETLWDHRPLTDFWRVGRGYSKKLEAHGLYTMGDIAHCSLGQENEFHCEELLYRMFGVNAELLIDHAWGHEVTTIAEIKAYKPSTSGLVSGQVLTSPYTFEKGRLVVMEMADLFSYELIKKGLVTNQITLTVGFDVENIKDPEIRKNYGGEVKKDGYGRLIPKHVHKGHNLSRYTSSSKLLVEGFMHLYDTIVDKNLLLRRVTLGVNRLLREDDMPDEVFYEQLNLFTSQEEIMAKEALEHELLKEKSKQKAILKITEKYGKNALLKGISLEEGATAKDRNTSIGGHKA